MKTNKLTTCFAIICICLCTVLSAQKSVRVEPSNWWVGMRHNSLELLIHGEGIGLTIPSLTYPGVEITSVQVVPNKNYLFINLIVHEQAKPGTVKINFADQNRKTIIQKDFPLLEREPGRSELKGFNPSDVVYVITPDRFANGDPENDNVASMKERANRKALGGRHGGDIKGIDQGLDYIKDMGYTAIWINPMMENNMNDHSYHGYAITDLYRTDPRYGTNAQYKQLVANAKSKGIKVIIDMVANHIGLEHWWMADMPMHNWVNQWDVYTETNHRKTVVQDPYAAEIDRKVFFDGWFVPTMPDLNQRNNSLARYLIQNTIWWIEYAGIAGIRMDTYPYPDMCFMAEWTKAVMDEYPHYNIVGEEWNLFPATIAYWQLGKANPNGYVSHLKSLMDFPLQDALVKALNGKTAWSSSWSSVYESIAQDYLYADPTNLMTFADNHDMSRMYTQLKENLASWKMAVTLLLTTRGIPSVYYGSEVLMSNPKSEDHGEIRSDFPGGWPSDPVNAFTGKGLSKDQKDASDFMKTLLHWRKNASVVHSGKLLHYSPDTNDVYVYFRYNDTKRVMVLLNKNSEDVQLALDKYKEGIASRTKGKEVLTGNLITLGDKLKVPARTAMVVELE